LGGVTGVTRVEPTPVSCSDLLWGSVGIVTRSLQLDCEIARLVP